jgi:hypothetical protein
VYCDTPSCARNEVKSIEENHEVTALALYVRVFTMFCSVLFWSDLGE